MCLARSTALAFTLTIGPSVFEVYKHSWNYNVPKLNYVSTALHARPAIFVQLYQNLVIVNILSDDTPTPGRAG